MMVSRIKFLPAILAASVLTLTSCEQDELLESQDASQASESTAAYNNGNRYIVTLKNGATASDEQIERILGRNQLAGKEFGKMFGKAFKGFALELSSEELALLRADENVAQIENDQVFALGGGNGNGGKKDKTSTTTAAGTTTLSTTSTSPTTSTTTSPTTTSTTTNTTSTTSSYLIAPLAGQTLSWGATQVGIGNGAATGRTAWIVDSGIDFTHPDLNVDQVRSRSFLSTTTSAADQFGHGTNVAGILAAKNNGYGVVGIAAGAPVVSLRVMDANGAGSISAVIAALNYVAQNASAGDVVNLSLGASPSLALDNAVIAVANLGIYVTIAAGNSSANSANYSPARVNHANVFTVSGMRADKSFMGISNWGSPVDYVAPGTGLQSTKINGAYGSVGGTSMAAPHVAGILLVRGNVLANGFVTGDPDGNPDTIASL